MKSIRELYRIGTGPSSSHTMAPRRAAEIFLHRNPECGYFRVTLYGSLAATGKGHLTDQAIFDVLRPHGNVELIWEPSIFKPFHPNGMRFEAVEDDQVVDDWTVYSVGGGALAEENSAPIETADIYPDTKLVEAVEVAEHPWYIGVQYYPQYNSTVLKPHPLFLAFIKAAIEA